MPLTPEQRARRRLSIGGSEIGAIAGVNPHKSALQVYLEKLGLDNDDGREETENQMFGNVFEDPVAEFYGLKHGVRVDALSETLVHPEYSFLTANPDRVIVSLERLLEIKTTGVGGLKYWIDPDNPAALRPPQHVLLQVNWYLGFLGWEEADIGLLNFAESYIIGRYHEFPVYFDRELFELEKEIAIQFWRNHVEAKVPPDADDPDDRAVQLNLSYPTHNEDMLPADAEASEIAKRLYEANQQKKHWEQRATELGNQMKAIIGGKLGIEDPGRWRYTWKFTSSGGIDWKGLALSMSPSQEQLNQFAKKGYRRPYFYYKPVEATTDGDAEAQ